MFVCLQVRERDCEIMHDSNGRSTGIAYVTFPSRSLANQAIREKDGKHIGTRYVELSLYWTCTYDLCTTGLHIVWTVTILLQFGVISIIVHKYMCVWLYNVHVCYCSLIVIQTSTKLHWCVSTDNVHCMFWQQHHILLRQGSYISIINHVYKLHASSAWYVYIYMYLLPIVLQCSPACGVILL